MDLKLFNQIVAKGGLLVNPDVRLFMHEMSEDARRVTFKLNRTYNSPSQVRLLLSRLIGAPVDESVRVFPPLYSDFGKNIHLGRGVFINAGCHFQDHGGVTLGDDCQIGHNIVFATLNHGLSPDSRTVVHAAPIILGRGVWVGSNSTILPGVTIGDYAVVAAGAVVTKSVAPRTLVGGVPARVIRQI